MNARPRPRTFKRTIIFIPIDKLVRMADTNNVSYLPNSKRMKTLVDSMLKDGMQNPLVVRRIEGSDSYLVIDGNHRLFILKDWGWKEIPCVISLSTVGRR